MPENSDIKRLNTYPPAFVREGDMMDELRAYPEYIETRIFHDWSPSSHEVTWYYSFESAVNSEWELKVKHVIEKHMLGKEHQ